LKCGVVVVVVVDKVPAAAVPAEVEVALLLKPFWQVT
jgi:hypothetical protein